MHASIRRPRGRPRRNDPIGIAPVEPPPCTRDEALALFLDEDYAFRLVVGLRWPTGIRCPHCQGADPGYLTTRQIWKCRVPECRRQFSVRVDTLLEDSPILLGQWLSTFWLFANEPNGISSYGLREILGVTQKTGWLMLRRIRIATERASLQRLAGDDDRARFLALVRIALQIPRSQISQEEREPSDDSSLRSTGRRRSGLSPGRIPDPISLTYT